VWSENHFGGPWCLCWTSASIDCEPEFSWIHLYVGEIEWSRGVLDCLLHLVADDQIGNVTVTDPDVRRVASSI
jgi:hypothetical protein